MKSPPLTVRLLPPGLFLAFGLFCLLYAAIEAWKGHWGVALPCAGIGASWLIYSKLIHDWWETGYYRGRADVLNSQVEGFRHGMSYSDWVVAELERDGFTEVPTNEEGKP